MDDCLIEGGRVINGIDEEPIENCNLFIKNGKIDKLAKGKITVPAGIKRINVSGMTVMPGLIDSHIHISTSIPTGPEETPVQRTLRRYAAWPSSYALGAYLNGLKCLEAGYTAVRDCGSRGDSLLALRHAINAGFMKGPRIQVAGGIHATMSHSDEGQPNLPRSKNIVDGVDNIRKAVRERVHDGFDLIKTSTSNSYSHSGGKTWYRGYSMEELLAMTDEAHAFRIPVCVHAYEAIPGVKNAVLAGIDSIEHGIFLNEEVVELMKDRGTYLVPTLSVFKLNHFEGTSNPYIVSDIDQRTKEVWGLHQKSVKMSIDAGVKIGAATDASTQYDLIGNNALELELLVDVGMTPMDTIKAATKVNSEIMRMDKDIGTLEPGKLADLIVIDGDPLKDIRVLQEKTKIKLVMIGGKPVVDKMQ